MSPNILVFPFVSLLFAAAGLPAAAQSTITSQQADAIIQELRGIRQLLERGGSPQAHPAPSMPQMAPSAKLAVDPALALGKKDAPITIVEYTDTQCGFCKRFHQQAFAEIRQKLIDTGKVRFISRDFPLDFGSISVTAAESVRCAGEQGKYWPMRDAVMSFAGRITQEGLNDVAGKAGVDLALMGACVQSHKYRPMIEADVKEAAKLNVAGTPAFVIGKTTPEGVEGVTLMGAVGFEAFEAKIREAQGAK